MANKKFEDYVIAGDNITLTYDNNADTVTIDAAGNVDSVNGQVGVVVLTKTNIGLGNVDNTSDVNKPISSATQTALNGKQDTLVSGTNIKTVNSNSLLGSGDIVIDKSSVGLGNVANVDTTNASNITSGTLGDARLSSNVTTQGNTFNAANKLVQLDGTAKLPAVDGSQLTNLPSFTPPNGLLKIASAISTTFQNVTDYLANASVLFLNSRRIGIGKDTSVTTQSVAVVEVQDTNTSIVLKPNGTGGIIASVPDGTATGGNARGNYAVDLQSIRTAATQVASGNNSIVIGTNNTAATFGGIAIGTSARTGAVGGGIAIGDNVSSITNYSIGIGRNIYTNDNASVIIGNTISNVGGRTVAIGGNITNASGYDAVNLGSGNTTSSNYSVVSGGQSNTASTNTHATVVGGQSNTASGQYSIAGGNGNTSSGSNSLCMGGSGANTASNNRSIVIGGEGNTANAGISAVLNSMYCTASGSQSMVLNSNSGSSATGSNSMVINKGNASGIQSIAFNEGKSDTALSISFNTNSRSSLHNQFAISNGVNINGGSQSSQLIASNLGALTTAATLILSLDGTGVTNLIIPNISYSLATNRAWNVTIDTIAIVTIITGTATGVSVGDCYRETKQLLFKRIAGTSAIVGTVDTSAIKSDSGMATALLTITVGASQQMAITFTAPTFAGGGSVTCRVVSKVSLVEVAY